MKYLGFDYDSDHEKKALELVAKMGSQDQSISYETAKKLVLVAIDEILNNIKATMLYHKDSEVLLINKTYWLQVKTALNNIS